VGGGYIFIHRMLLEYFADTRSAYFRKTRRLHFWNAGMIAFPCPEVRRALRELGRCNETDATLKDAAHERSKQCERVSVKGGSEGGSDIPAAGPQGRL
jgi:hypothetical protein